VAQEEAGSPYQINHKRIKQKFEEAGYDMPEMVYWNLAAGGRGPNPIILEDIGTTLVRGYSQALLKVFMEGGSFAYGPLGRVEQGVGHESYDVLEILD